MKGAQLMKLKILLTATLAIASIICSHQALAVDSFSEAKAKLPGIMKQLDNPSTLYCGCPLIFERNRYYPDLKACGYKVRRNAKRATRIEAEHIMPAWEFGRQRLCWQNGGRKQCNTTDEQFRKIEGDLHNLYPAVGEINGDRSNYHFSDWNGKAMYGQCEMAVDFKHRQAQPPERARGLIARTYLYMADEYNISITKQQQRLYEAWNNIYPPQKDECTWNRVVAKVQGNENHFVSEACEIAGF